MVKIVNCVMICETILVLSVAAVSPPCYNNM